MTENPADSPPEKPWDKNVQILVAALFLAFLTLLAFHSKAGALFVFVIVFYCRTWQDFRIFLYVGIGAIFLRSFAYEPFNIPSGSMKSTLLIGDYLFVSKFSYGYSRYSFPFGLPLFPGRVMENNMPQRGDVVVFREPADPRVDFIKRLIGLPGDHIQVKGGIVYINGEPLKRRQVDDFTDTENPGNVHPVPRFVETMPDGRSYTILKQVPNDLARIDGQHTVDDTPVFLVPPGHYFMMGDNRDNSHDSRFPDLRYVPQENLVGRAEIVFFSIDTAMQWANPDSWFSLLRLDRFFKRIE